LVRSDRGAYGTHQGVKGLEFDRVFVVMDDSEARGFLFSYEKLFGARTLSAGDLQRSAEGSETAVDRTRRLLYVTCTRARRSLALVVYTDNPDDLAKAVMQQGWFEADELVRM
jgi:DNA helicase II / ATP-dependent DNA helicase PcrA